ncbi:MAG: GNAT family N-acetyltransferase [Clostridia bacterium]|nr:GNAT family N-acetyltransferase [Clostridia bacterium]
MKTERLIIDQIKETDKEDYFINISHDKKVLETFICRYADSLEEFDFSSYPGREDLFAIRLKETGRLIGIVNFFDEKGGVCEIGYGIGSGYWGHGYVTEAVRRFLAYLFREKGMRTVYASFFTGNEASRRVMEKCGMTYDHVSEKELTYLDIERDLTYYVIHRKPDVILLNGPSSAGKSSIAKALKQLLLDSGTDAVILSLDDYLQMSANEPIWEDDVFAIMPHMCEGIAAALRDGKTVIIDHVITSFRIWQALCNAVSGFQMKTVLVRCDVETLRRREAERGDRCVGSAEASGQYLYPKTGYDLCVDSSEASPAILAEKIINSMA